MSNQRKKPILAISGTEGFNAGSRSQRRVLKRPKEQKRREDGYPRISRTHAGRARPWFGPRALPLLLLNRAAAEPQQLPLALKLTQRPPELLEPQRPASGSLPLRRHRRSESGGWQASVTVPAAKEGQSCSAAVPAAVTMNFN